MDRKNGLIIFTRNPELGKCKTRLARVIGDEVALDIYRLLLKHTAEVTRQVDADKYVFYTEQIVVSDIWDDSIFHKKIQRGDDLGEKMNNAFMDVFNNEYEKVMIVGSDLFDLTPQIIEDAFRQLDKHDIVIGPSEDGGYYLLGMKALHSGIFQNKEWGNATVLAETLECCEHLKTAKLPELNDIDTYEDLMSSQYFNKNYQLKDSIKSFI